LELDPADCEEPPEIAYEKLADSVVLSIVLAMLPLHENETLNVCPTVPGIVTEPDVPLKVPPAPLADIENVAVGVPYTL
jgi:hypothetical protein